MRYACIHGEELNNLFIIIIIWEQQCSVLSCKASFNRFRVKWQLLKSCVLLWSVLKRKTDELHPMLWNIFTHSYLLAAELLMDASLCARSLYFHDCSSCFSSTARWLSRPAILMREAWTGWAFLPWRPWIQLCGEAQGPDCWVVCTPLQMLLHQQTAFAACHLTSQHTASSVFCVTLKNRPRFGSRA